MFTKKLLQRLIYCIIIVQVLLLFVDGFPTILSLLSIGSHAIYARNLRHFPTVRLTDPVLIFSCGIQHYLTSLYRLYSCFIDTDNENSVLVVLNHFFWFRHFSTPPPLSSYSSRYPSSRYDNFDIPSFTEIASYFGLCIWLVPFSLFVSLSVGENVLPSMGSEYATGETKWGARNSGSLGVETNARGRKAKGLVKAAIDGAMEWLNEAGQLLGVWQREKERV